MAVAELMNLVGGEHGAGDSQAPATTRGKTVRSAGQNPKIIAAARGNGHAALASVPATGASNRNTIPLDGDFKDF